MRFIANDGKIFDTAEECKEYEEKENKTDKNLGKEIAELWDRYISTYDSEGREIKPQCSRENFKDYLNELEDIIASSSFIKICCITEEWEKIKKYLKVNYKIYYIPYKNGLWRYDTAETEWISFAEEYEDFKAVWAPAGIEIIASN